MIIVWKVRLGRDQESALIGCGFGIVPHGNLLPDTDVFLPGSHLLQRRNLTIHLLVERNLDRRVEVFAAGTHGQNDTFDTSDIVVSSVCVLFIPNDASHHFLSLVRQAESCESHPTARVLGAGGQRARMSSFLTESIEQHVIGKTGGDVDITIVL